MDLDHVGFGLGTLTVCVGVSLVLWWVGYLTFRWIVTGVTG